MCFDDILLVPQDSDIMSRSAVDMSATIGCDSVLIPLSLPIIAAPMDTICGRDMCMSMAAAGGLGILHRYMSYDKQLWQAKTLVENNIVFGVAIASNNGFMDHAQKLVDAGVRILLVDTANGHGQYAINAVRQLKDHFPDVHIMAGNISTYHGYMSLADAGVDSVRVGIGGGGLCTTRLVSGHGMPTLASIMDIRERVERGYGPSIIADGGIKTSGDAVKAFAAGADVVMLGSALAGTEETPGSIINIDGERFKKLRGMASEAAQKEGRGSVSVIEGVSTMVPYNGPVSSVLKQWAGGIGSGLSYSGVDNLYSLYKEAQYITISHSALAENKPHSKRN